MQDLHLQHAELERPGRYPGGSPRIWTCSGDLRAVCLPQGSAPGHLDERGERKEGPPAETNTAADGQGEEPLAQGSKERESVSARMRHLFQIGNNTTGNLRITLCERKPSPCQGQKARPQSAADNVNLPLGVKLHNYMQWCEVLIIFLQNASP